MARFAAQTGLQWRAEPTSQAVHVAELARKLILRYAGPTARSSRVVPADARGDRHILMIEYMFIPSSDANPVSDAQDNVS